MYEYSKKLDLIEIQDVLEKKRKWYGKTKEAVYRLINEDIKSENFYNNGKRNYVHYYKGDSVKWFPGSERPLSNQETPYFEVNYYENGNSFRIPSEIL